MMTRAIGYAAPAAKAELSRYEFERRAPRATDVDIDIVYCGVCHSDLHQARDEWGGSIFPMVPGHEIVGRVLAVGSAVTKVAPGELVGVGCMVDSCRTCPSCAEGLENYCEAGFVPTYNGYERGTKTPTQGGCRPASRSPAPRRCSAPA
jgi:alcohol dehydrogenase (NADP+)